MRCTVPAAIGLPGAPARSWAPAARSRTVSQWDQDCDYPSDAASGTAVMAMGPLAEDQTTTSSCFLQRGGSFESTTSCSSEGQCRRCPGGKSSSSRGVDLDGSCCESAETPITHTRPPKQVAPRCPPPPHNKALLGINRAKRIALASGTGERGQYGTLHIGSNSINELSGSSTNVWEKGKATAAGATRWRSGAYLGKRDQQLERGLGTVEGVAAATVADTPRREQYHTLCVQASDLKPERMGVQVLPLGARLDFTLWGRWGCRQVGRSLSQHRCNNRKNHGAHQFEVTGMKRQQPDLSTKPDRVASRPIVHGRLTPNDGPGDIQGKMPQHGSAENDEHSPRTEHRSTRVVSDQGLDIDNTPGSASVEEDVATPSPTSCACTPRASSALFLERRTESLPKTDEPSGLAIPHEYQRPAHSPVVSDKRSSTRRAAHAKETSEGHLHKVLSVVSVRVRSPTAKENNPTFRLGFDENDAKLTGKRVHVPRQTRTSKVNTIGGSCRSGEVVPKRPSSMSPSRKQLLVDIDALLPNADTDITSSRTASAGLSYFRRYLLYNRETQPSPRAGRKAASPGRDGLGEKRRPYSSGTRTPSREPSDAMGRKSFGNTTVVVARGWEIEPTGACASRDGMRKVSPAVRPFSARRKLSPPAVEEEFPAENHNPPYSGTVVECPRWMCPRAEGTRVTAEDVRVEGVGGDRGGPYVPGRTTPDQKRPGCSIAEGANNAQCSMPSPHAPIKKGSPPPSTVEVDSPASGPSASSRAEEPSHRKEKSAFSTLEMMSSVLGVPLSAPNGVTGVGFPIPNSKSCAPSNAVAPVSDTHTIQNHRRPDCQKASTGSRGNTVKMIPGTANALHRSPVWDASPDGSVGDARHLAVTSEMRTPFGVTYCPSFASFWVGGGEGGTCGAGAYDRGKDAFCEDVGGIGIPERPRVLRVELELYVKYCSSEEPPLSGDRFGCAEACGSRLTSDAGPLTTRADEFATTDTPFSRFLKENGPDRNAQIRPDIRCSPSSRIESMPLARPLLNGEEARPSTPCEQIARNDEKVLVRAASSSVSQKGVEGKSQPPGLREVVAAESSIANAAAPSRTMPALFAAAQIRRSLCENA